jgi:hypothetical protein
MRVKEKKRLTSNPPPSWTGSAAASIQHPTFNLES